MKKQSITFIKNSTYYWAERNEETIAIIYIHYNFYDHSNYYTVGDKQFNYLKDAKTYIKENF